MFENIKEKVNNPVFRSAVKDAAINVATTVVAAIVIKAVMYVAVEGSKKLIDEMFNKETSAE